MNQNIGIAYAVTGSDQVVAAFQKMEQGALGMQKSLAALNAVWSELSLHATKGLSAAREIGRQFGYITGTARTAKIETGAFVATLRQLQGIKLPKLVMPTVAPGGIGTASGAAAAGAMGQGRSGAQGIFGDMGAFGFMGRFLLFHEAIKAGRYGIGLGMGKERVGTDEALAELSAVNFDKMQKYQTEVSAHKFATRYPNISAEEYIKGMSQTASAFSVDKLGVGILKQMNESAMMTAKMSKMSPEAAAEMQSKLLNQYLTAQPKNVYSALQSGGSANVRGFGNVNLGQMSEKMMAMVTKSIEISNIWGKGITEFMQYVAPVMAQKGWDPAAMLAYAGTMVDVGFKGAKSGRAMKDIMVSAPEDYARLMMANEGLLKIGARGRAKQEQEDEVRRRAAGISKVMSDPDKFAQFLEKAVVPAMAYANKLSQDPRYGLSMVKDLGFSKDFLPQILALAQGGTVERLKQQTRDIRGADFSELKNKMDEAVNTVGHGWKQLGNASKRLTDSIVASEGILSKFTGVLAAAANKVSAYYEKENTQNRLNNMVKKFQSRGKEESGFVTDIGKVKDLPQTLREINAWMKEEYKVRMSEFPKPGKDASEFTKEEWKQKEREVYDQIMRTGRTAYDKAAGLDALTEGKNQPSWIAGGGDTQAYRSAGEAVVKFGSAVREAIRSIRNSIPRPSDPLNDETQQKAVGAPMSYEGGASAQPKVDVHITLGDEPIRNMVKQVVAEQSLENRNRFGNTWS